MIRNHASLFSLLSLILVFSCQHELAFDTTSRDSDGSLQKDAAGDCVMMLNSGNFTKDVEINDSNWVEVKVIVQRAGLYSIHSNVVNGFSFSSNGVFNSAGTFLVKLKGKGRPLAEGTNRFTVTYGSSNCEFTIDVQRSPVPVAQFTLMGAPGLCMNPVLTGAFVVGQALDTSCQVTLTINVSSPGTYSITTNRMNGYQFEASDTVRATGEQKIILKAVGIPTIAGTDVFSVALGPSACTFPSSAMKPFQPTSPDYFPLSEGSYWVYDYPGYTNDSLLRSVSGSITLEGTNYVVMKEKNPYADEKDLFFRKLASGYREYASPDKYTQSFAYVPGITGEIPILEEVGTTWSSPLYLAKSSFGQNIKLRYSYSVLETDGVALVNGQAYEHVIKVRMNPLIAAEGYSEGSTGETHLFYFAKGVGLIYTSLTKGPGPVYEQRLRRWLVK
jgi:hypothetical protein